MSRSWIAAIDRKDVDGIRAAYAPGARLVAMLHEGAEALPRRRSGDERRVVFAGRAGTPPSVRDSAAAFLTQLWERAASAGSASTVSATSARRRSSQGARTSNKCTSGSATPVPVSRAP